MTDNRAKYLCLNCRHVFSSDDIFPTCNCGHTIEVNKTQLKELHELKCFNVSIDFLANTYKEVYLSGYRGKTIMPTIESYISKYVTLRDFFNFEIDHKKSFIEKFELINNTYDEYDNKGAIGLFLYSISSIKNSYPKYKINRFIITAIGKDDINDFFKMYKYIPTGIDSPIIAVYTSINKPPIAIAYIQVKLSKDKNHIYQIDSVVEGIDNDLIRKCIKKYIYEVGLKNFI